MQSAIRVYGINVRLKLLLKKTINKLGLSWAKLSLSWGVGRMI